MTEVARAEVPELGGNSGSFANYEAKETLWKKILTMGPDKKAAHLLLHMSDVARDFCVTAGEDVRGNSERADQISKISRGRLAPDAIDSSFQDVAKSMYSKRADQDMDTYLTEFDALRQKAETRMLMGAGFPN